MFGQGFIVLNNRVANVVIAPVYGADPSAENISKTGNTPAGVPPGTQTYDGPLLAGTGFTAQLFAGPLGTADEDLQPLSPATFFRTGLNGGLVAPPSGALAVPFVPAGARARLQLRVWDNQDSTLNSWPEVLASPDARRGVSPPFDSAPLGTTNSPANLAGLTSFNLNALPAPGYPLILVPPQSQTANPGSTVTLGVTVSGSIPFSYQWRFNGVDIAGATDGALILPNVQPIDSGYYTVLVNNTGGAALSSAAVLNVALRPVLVSPHFIGGQIFQFTLVGETGRDYAIEASSNLSNWSVVTTVNNVTGQVQFTQTNGLSPSLRCFRARLLP